MERQEQQFLPQASRSFALKFSFLLLPMSVASLLSESSDHFQIFLLLHSWSPPVPSLSLSALLLFPGASELL